MDIDIDWCLTCEKRVEGDSPYCSPDCHDRAGPSHYYYSQSDHLSSSILDNDDDEDDVIFHTIDDAAHTPQSYRWTGNDSAGISAWAADIPSGAPAGGISSPTDDSSSFYSLSGGTYRQPPPNLLKTQRRLVPPTLSVATPPSVLPPPSTPMVTPKRQMSSAAQPGNASTGHTSLRSAATESSLVATPASSQPVPIAAASRRPSIIDDMYCHVRSWVSPSPAPVSTKPHPQTPVLRVDLQKFAFPPRTTTFPPVKIVSSPQSLRGFSEQSAGCWVAGPVLVEQPQTKRPNIYEPSRGRKPTTELPFRHDDHPSFRTRGRKASRAAA
ncbi:hypothetical protein GALMADRAFT_146678 [Galerina marginata CBS 339.88]|uniref:Uncharacterized protein n=1 Tax=Galerina marginata (strain CBS 339.88) TaxID=685588 RepID=A0A067SJS1_GALM3|nr:hypothetical protein GALMADRAFT_146678 [Galerina marginata CBS 339.88]